mmetsp:Transcript_13435/g.26169  ORF Transcript_13435/g.26169 Transcript_13435/m.26169 type:complete len:309 (-) Transcript_13435:40-966(-)
MDRFDTTGYSCSRRAPQHSQLICCLNSVRSINAGLHHRLHARTCTDLVTPNTQTRLLRQIIPKEKLYIILAVATILVECTDATRILALNEEQQNCATAANTSIYAAAAFTDKEMSVLQQLVLQTKGQETTYDRTLVMRALAIREHKARMLVFGCGRDSVFWAKHMNRHGETVFLEDNKEWAALNVGLKTHLVKYNTAPLQAWLDKMDADAASADRHNAWTPLNEQQIASLSITGAPLSHCTPFATHPPTGRRRRRHRRRQRRCRRCHCRRRPFVCLEASAALHARDFDYTLLARLTNFSWCQPVHLKL